MKERSSDCLVFFLSLISPTNMPWTTCRQVPLRFLGGHISKIDAFSGVVGHWPIPKFLRLNYKRANPWWISMQFNLSHGEHLCLLFSSKPQDSLLQVFVFGCSKARMERFWSFGPQQGSHQSRLRDKLNRQPNAMGVLWTDTSNTTTALTMSIEHIWTRTETTGREYFSILPITETP